MVRSSDTKKPGRIGLVDHGSIHPFEASVIPGRSPFHCVYLRMNLHPSLDIGNSVSLEWAFLRTLGTRWPQLKPRSFLWKFSYLSLDLKLLSRPFFFSSTFHTQSLGRWPLHFTSLLSSVRSFKILSLSLFLSLLLLGRFGEAHGFKLLLSTVHTQTHRQVSSLDMSGEQ